MKVIEYADHGTPHEVCRCIETAEPGDPGPGEVVVAVEASAINPADLLIVEGRYPGPAELPARQGIEGAGRIEALGDGVEDLAEGDRVMLLGRANWAETVRLPAEQAVKIPQALDILQAAQMKANPPTAKFMLEDYVDLEPGDWVIQNAANSAVGRHVIRFAASRGIKTINVVRRPTLAPPLEAIGADLVVVDGDDLGERVRAEIGDAALPLALDAAAGAPCRRLADCLSDGGLVVNYGFLTGQPCMITPTHVIIHRITLKGFWLVNRLFQRPRAEIENTYAEIADLFMDGTLHAPVEATYTLDRVTEALAHAERDGRDGKIVFTPRGSVL